MSIFIHIIRIQSWAKHKVNFLSAPFRLHKTCVVHTTESFLEAFFNSINSTAFKHKLSHLSLKKSGIENVD